MPSSTSSVAPQPRLSSPQRNLRSFEFFESSEAKELFPSLPPPPKQQVLRDKLRQIRFETSKTERESIARHSDGLQWLRTQRLAKGQDFSNKLPPSEDDLGFSWRQLAFQCSSANQVQDEGSSWSNSLFQEYTFQPFCSSLPDAHGSDDLLIMEGAKRTFEERQVVHTCPSSRVLNFLTATTITVRHMSKSPTMLSPMSEI